MVKKTIKKIDSEAAVEVEEEQKAQRRRGCSYCETKLTPAYVDTQTLKRFLSERGKILPKGYTKACSKHQRAVTKQIKYARHLALLPFTPKV